MQAPERVVVIGAGAIGASVGALLYEAEVDVVLVARGEHGRAIGNDGLDLRRPDGGRRIRVPVVGTAQDAAPTPADLVILATMGQHTLEAVDGVDPSVPVASFQNGLVPVQQLAARGHPTLGAMMYFSVERRAPGRVALFGTQPPGAFLVGAWPSGVHPWASWLAKRLVAGGFRAEAEADVAPWMRAKLLLNLGGIVAAVCDDPPKDVIDAARREAVAVWLAEQVRHADTAQLLDRIGPIATAPVDGVARIGGSTRGALARGESLETALLHGPILEAGLRTGVPTPVNRALVRLAGEAVSEGRSPGYLTADALRSRIASERA